MGATLLILAAGMASRYGSLKQIEQVGPSGETILDYSIYDAIKAGFTKVVFVIRPEIEKKFKEFFAKKLQNHIAVDYVFQEINMVPEGIELPLHRVKPWGTSHAVLVAEKKINEPFAVINADDYYGVSAFQQMFKFLSTLKVDDHTYSMIGYDLGNTLSEFGTVSRGICTVDHHSSLIGITEQTNIGCDNQGVFFKDEKDQLTFLNPESIVSMNFWGFTPFFFSQVKEVFKAFVSQNFDKPKAEIYLPLVLDDLMKNKKASVKVLHSSDKWFGVTYKEDKPKVVSQIKSLIEAGMYPYNLWKQL